MKVIPLFITVFLFASAIYSHAQNQFVVHEDIRVQRLVKLRDAVIVCFPLTNKVTGYRILVSTTNNRDAAYQLKHQLQEHYTGHNVYMSYQTPFFTLKIGDFLKRDDAEDLQEQVSRMIKQAAYIVPDRVILKPTM